MTLRTIRSAAAERPAEDVGDRVKWLLDADLAEPPVKKFYAAYDQWPRNKMRVYRDPYEELILVQWHSQWRLRNSRRRSVAALLRAGDFDGATRVAKDALRYSHTMDVLREVFLDGRES